MVTVLSSMKHEAASLEWARRRCLVGPRSTVLLSALGLALASFLLAPSTAKAQWSDGCISAEFANLCEDNFINPDPFAMTGSAWTGCTNKCSNPCAGTACPSVCGTPSTCSVCCNTQNRRRVQECGGGQNCIYQHKPDLDACVYMCRID